MTVTSDIEQTTFIEKTIWIQKCETFSVLNQLGYILFLDVRFARLTIEVDVINLICALRCV